MSKPEDTELHIFARWKDGVTEFFVGDSGCFIEQFHDATKWDISMNECRPCCIYDALERDVDMLRIIYPEYTFGFYKLTFKKRDANEPDNTTGGTKKGLPESIPNTICPDSD